jgi:multicomponent Na+:H+ antiporter subunit C
MTVSLVLLIVMAVLFASGVYLLLERSMTRVLLGFLLVGNGANLLILIMGGEAGPEDMSDPLPQALILTAIVITFAVSAFLMALIYRSWRLANNDTVSDDEDDVAMREFASGVESEAEEAASPDTEFGNRAEAAVTDARDLERSDEEEAARAADSASAPKETR